MHHLPVQASNPFSFVLQVMMALGGLQSRKTYCASFSCMMKALEPKDVHQKAVAAILDHEMPGIFHRDAFKSSY